MRSKLNGIQIDYDLKGPKNAPLVTLVHGFPFSRALWKPQVPALAKRFRVLSYDLRGMGKSGLGPAPQLLEAYVDDLFALLNHVRAERTALAGLSMGGYIALRAVQREPARFWALALCDTRAEADPDTAKLNRSAGIATLRGKGIKSFAEGMLPKLLAPATLTKQPKVAAGLKSMMLKTSVDGACNALAAMAARTDSSALLSQLKLPALCLVGEQDALTPPELAKAMAAVIPGAELALIAQAGHVSNLEQPAAFNQALSAFFERASPKP